MKPDHEGPSPGCYCYLCEVARKRAKESMQDATFRRSSRNPVTKALGPACFSSTKRWWKPSSKLES